MKVILDGDDLEVSDICKEFLLNEGRGFDGAERFYSKFGEFCVSCCHEALKIYVWTGTIFTSSVLLGARLHNTIESSSVLEVTEKTTKEEKKAAVSASFSSPFVSGSAGASYANATEDGKGFKKEDKSGRMNWEARGGTTFLAIEWVRKGCPTEYWKYISFYDSPPSWINTVGMYQNWRVLEVSWIFNVWFLLEKE